MTNQPSEKAYVIYDERALTMDTDDCSVLEACGTLIEVCRSGWDGQRDPLGVVFEYDLVPVEGRKHPEAINGRKLGTVPEVKARRYHRSGCNNWWDCDCGEEGSAR